MLLYTVVEYRSSSHQSDPHNLTLILAVDQQMQSRFLIDENADRAPRRKSVEIWQSADPVRGGCHAHFHAVVEKMRLTEDPRTALQAHRRQGKR